MGGAALSLSPSWSATSLVAARQDGTPVRIPRRAITGVRGGLKSVIDQTSINDGGTIVRPDVPLGGGARGRVSCSRAPSPRRQPRVAMNSPPLSGGKRKLGEIDLLEAARASARALVSKFEPAKQAASAYASYASTYGASLTPHAYGYAPPVSDSTSAWTAAAAAAGPQVVQSYTRERVGRIIGPGGCNITVIRKESGAKIKIDSNCVAGHQQVTYSGTDAEIQAAIALVERLLATPDLGGQGEAADGAPRAEHKQELDKESAGKVIGQGGATIKNIRESSGAYIKISNEKIPGVETQTLTVGGTEEQVRMRLSSGACFRPSRWVEAAWVFFSAYWAGMSRTILMRCGRIWLAPLLGDRVCIVPS